MISSLATARQSERIHRAFSRAARQYDELSFLQQTIGRKLLSRIALPQPHAYVLDVGMGTGRLTEELRALCPQARVVGIDVAAGMVARAKEKYRDLNIVQADAGALPFHDGIFDLIVSNVTYQWVWDLPQAFRLCHECLRPQGRLFLTLFGQGSLKELFASLEAVRGPDEEKNFFLERRLPSTKEVSGALCQAGMENRIQQEMMQVSFKDMFALLFWLKGIGANRLGQGRYVGRQTLRKAQAYYRQHFPSAKGIYASFELMTVTAQKERTP